MCRGRSSDGSPTRLPRWGRPASSRVTASTAVPYRDREALVEVGERRGSSLEGPMATLREWVSRLWGTLSRNRADRDLEEELRLHLELAAEDARRRGGSPEGALRAARHPVRRHRSGHGGAARPARAAMAPGSRDATCATAAACSPRTRASPSSPSSRSRLASAPTPRSSALPIRCCSGRSRCRARASC